MAADGLTDEMIEELREAFNLFDRQKDGTINSRYFVEYNVCHENNYSVIHKNCCKKGT